MEADWARKMHAQLCPAKHSFPRVASHFVFRLKNFAFIYAMESASLHLSQLKVPAKVPRTSGWPAPQRWPLRIQALAARMW